MANVSTNEFKAGLKIILQKEPYSIITNEFIKPGKGQAFNRVKLKRLLTGKTIEKTFKSGESVELADIQEKELTFLYTDSEFWYFMDNSNFEQIEIPEKALNETKKWMKEQFLYIIILWNNQAIQVIPPNFLELEVIETDPGLKGDTQGTGGKSALLSTGASVRVPLFIQKNEIIKVDTRSAEYISRVKN